MLPPTIKAVLDKTRIVDLRLHSSMELIKRSKKVHLVKLDKLLGKVVEILAFKIKRTTGVALVKYGNKEPLLCKLHSQAAKLLANRYTQGADD